MDQASHPLVLEILDALTDPVILIDSRKVIVRANSAAHRAWSGLANDIPLSFTLRMPDLIEAADQALAQGGTVSGELIERAPVERVYHFDVTSLSQSAKRGERGIAAAILIFRDLTEAKRLDQMRADFVANASHELRTPLASLLGFIETLQGPAKNDPVALTRFLDIMRTQARRMAHLIDDLLSLSRAEMSQHRQPVDPVDLNLVIRQMADTLKPMADERSIAIALELPDRASLVLGDRDELLRVVENLVENAIKYGRANGHVTIALKRQADTQSILVIDDGLGIPAEHLPRLTERFYRVNASASRESGGTGLGLAIVKHIVNRHRGKLTIESEPDQGSTFKITLPALESDP
jgi:two-component system phosphate regulon sensor histidine kinase PhoR